MTSYYHVGSWFLLKPNRMVMMWQSVVKGLCQVQGKHVPLHLHNRHQSVSCLSNIVFRNLSNDCFGSIVCHKLCPWQMCFFYNCMHSSFIDWTEWTPNKYVLYPPDRYWPLQKSWDMYIVHILGRASTTHKWKQLFPSWNRLIVVDGNLQSARRFKNLEVRWRGCRCIP